MESIQKYLVDVKRKMLLSENDCDRRNTLRLANFLGFCEWKICRFSRIIA